MRQLDLEYAGTQLVLLCWTPSKVYALPTRVAGAERRASGLVLTPPFARYKMTAWRKRASGGVAVARLRRDARDCGRATRIPAPLIAPNCGNSP